MDFSRYKSKYCDSCKYYFSSNGGDPSCQYIRLEGKEPDIVREFRQMCLVGLMNPRQ